VKNTLKRSDILFELTKIAGVDRCIVTVNNLETTFEIAEQFADLVRRTRLWEKKRKEGRI
jgi:hypothetical protein